MTRLDMEEVYGKLAILTTPKWILLKRFSYPNFRPNSG